MSVIRGLAVRLSAWAVRWSSPRSKEWAQGLSREVEYVEDDWAALIWAIGSTRMLLDRRSAATVSADGLSPLWWIFPLIATTQILGNVMDAFTAHSWHDRVAAGLIAAGWMCWAALNVDDWFWERDRPSISNIQAHRLFSRATLERRLRHHRSVRRWVPPFIAILICAGFLMKFEAGLIASAFVVCGGVFVLSLLFLDTPEKIQQRLALVNRLITEDADAAKQSAC